jgi:hypothetical protein
LEVDSLSKKWITNRITEPTNDDIEKEKRIKEASEPYIPFMGLYIDYAQWSWSDLSPKTFSNFHLTIKNYTSNDFKKLKFSLKVFVKNNSYESEIFSKTIEMNELLSAGDVIRHEIPDLRNFYAGVNLSDKKNFSWTVKIIDAKPKPGYEDLPY